MGSCPTFGLIGVGGVGACHLAILEALQKSGKISLAAVADPAIEQSPELQAELGRKNLRWYSNYRDLLDRESDLEAVTIASPIPFHFEMTERCLERGLMVNLEKPPVPLIQQLDSLVTRDTRDRVSVGFQAISSRCIRFLKDSIVAGKLGDVREIAICGCWPRLDSYYQRASWAGKMVSAGRPTFDGPATNALSHLVHDIMYLASPQPGEFEEPVEIRGELYRARPIESYDVACFRGRFSSGTAFYGALTHASENGLPYQIEVRGSKGSALVRQDGTVLESTTLGAASYPERFPEDIRIHYDDFVAFASGHRTRPPTRLRDTRGYVLAVNGLLLSSGGIHTIAQEHVRRYSRDGDAGYDVTGLVELTEAAFARRLLFSELGAPWARETQTRRLHDLRTLDLVGF